jgi:hypothetical protein
MPVGVSLEPQDMSSKRGFVHWLYWLLKSDCSSKHSHYHQEQRLTMIIILHHWVDELQA